ncbi:MAG: UvrD-helicase domain-containing protein [Gammaproteobacteria bacterium]|nr:UvrD-helicase domain-containing protein [Gammaproteobacteria bacterium]
MSDAVADSAQRRQALDTTCSFIVQAPAGSGKTELITQRFLRLLADVEHPEEILAITFTRKAAAEMRNRILDALDSARGPAPAATHRRLTWELARAALANDKRHQWQIGDAPNRLRIQTFDSLAHALARQMPVVSELGAAPATTERAEPHYREAARATLRLLDSTEPGDDLAVLLQHLDNRLQRLEDLLVDMLGRREQWLTHAVAGPEGEALNDALGAVVGDQLRQLQAECRPDWLHQLQVIGTEARQNRPGDVAEAQNAEALALGDSWDALASWHFLAGLLLTGSGSPRRSWTVREGFPAPGERGIDAEAKARRQQAKASIAALVGELQEQPQLLDRWQMVRMLPGKGLDDAQQQILSSLLRVLLHAALELGVVFQRTGEVDFSEMQMRAQRALGSPEEPTDLALSLDYRIRHLLVDEFQDTSLGQYRLLETLVAGWQPDDGRSLFAVGDPMQSIYRFRQAEVGNYLYARQHGIGQVRPLALDLSVNFRSTGAVVDWLNEAFPSVLAPAVDAARGAVPYSPAVSHNTDGDDDAVQVHPFAGRQDDDEAALVVELVRRALDADEAGTIAILARARSHLGTIATALRAAGIAFQAVDIDALTQRPVIRDLRALTRAMLHPGDRLAWLTLLRAPWLGLDIDDLLQIAGSGRRSPLAALRSDSVRTALSADARARVERLLDTIDRQLPARGRRPLRQWIEGTWLALGGAATGGAASAADAQAFFALLERHEQARGLPSLGQFDEALEKLFAAPDPAASGRLQLMTMHKSKGLEFDTVILPGLGRRARGIDSELLYWAEQADSSGDTHLLMAPIRSASQQGEPISDYLRALEKDRQAFETSRLLYVAATRARSKLHLLGHLGCNDKGLAERPEANSLLQRLWPVVADAFERLPVPEAAAPGSAGGPAPALWTLQRLAADWQPTGLPASADASTVDGGTDLAVRIDFDWAGDTARHVGTLVHRYLERIANEGIGHWPAARIDAHDETLRRALRSLGVADDELQAATDKTRRALRSTLSDDRGRWLLSAHPEARSEWPLTLNDDGVYRHFVIDRTFVDADGRRWIVDYKTGEHLDGDRDVFLDQEQVRYQPQLDNYARLLRHIEDRPIRLALYFPLFSDWRTWDYVD